MKRFEKVIKRTYYKASSYKKKVVYQDMQVLRKAKAQLQSIIAYALKQAYINSGYKNKASAYKNSDSYKKSNSAANNQRRQRYLKRRSSSRRNSKGGLGGQGGQGAYYSFIQQQKMYEEKLSLTKTVGEEISEYMTLIEYAKSQVGSICNRYQGSMTSQYKSSCNNLNKLSQYGQGYNYCNKKGIYIGQYIKIGYLARSQLCHAGSSLKYLKQIYSGVYDLYSGYRRSYLNKSYSKIYARRKSICAQDQIHNQIHYSKVTRNSDGQTKRHSSRYKKRQMLNKYKNQAQKQNYLNKYKKSSGNQRASNKLAARQYASSNRRQNRYGNKAMKSSRRANALRKSVTTKKILVKQPKYFFFIEDMYKGYGKFSYGPSSYKGSSYKPSGYKYKGSLYKPSGYKYKGSSYKPSGYKVSSYKPSGYKYKGSSYKPSGYKGSSYGKSSYGPSSYKGFSYRPSSYGYKGSSYKPSSYGPSSYGSSYGPSSYGYKKPVYKKQYKTVYYPKKYQSKQKSLKKMRNSYKSGYKSGYVQGNKYHSGAKSSRKYYYNGYFYQTGYPQQKSYNMKKAYKHGYKNGYKKAQRQASASASSSSYSYNSKNGKQIKKPMQKISYYKPHYGVQLATKGHRYSQIKPMKSYPKTNLKKCQIKCNTYKQCNSIGYKKKSRSCNLYPTNYYNAINSGHYTDMKSTKGLGHGNYHVLYFVQTHYPIYPNQYNQQYGNNYSGQGSKYNGQGSKYYGQGMNYYGQGMNYQGMGNKYGNKYGY